MAEGKKEREFGQQFQYQFYQFPFFQTMRRIFFRSLIANEVKFPRNSSIFQAYY